MPIGQMIDMVGYSGTPFHVDAALRVVTKRGAGYVDGNVHTHRGRFGVWYPDLGDGFATSLDEIESMTDEAACWIAGFLAGNEPDPYEYLGIRDLDPALGIEPTEAELTRWREFTATFRQTGQCPQLNARPAHPLTLTEQERGELGNPVQLRPWSLAGERIWVPSADTWLEADPQPELVHGQLTGTICAQRGYPDLMQLESGWSICIDCAEVTIS